MRDEDFRMRLTDDAGEVTELAVSPEQLDTIIDALDDLLSENEADIFEVDDESDAAGRA